MFSQQTKSKILENSSLTHYSVLEPEVRLRIDAEAIAFIESQVAEHNDAMPDDVAVEETADD